MRRAIVVVGAALCVAAGSVAAGGPAARATVPANMAPPAPVTLSSGWQLLADPGGVGFAQGWSGGAAGSGWQATTVPGVFDPEPLPALFHGTVEWYRVSFAGPPAPQGFAWAISFQQVRRAAQVWLNGVLLGSHSDPYTPFSLPATGLRPGPSNTLVVRVDNRKGVEPREGWWNWGGIPRPVTLVPQGPLVTSDPGLLPQLSCSGPDRCRARVLLDATVTNRSSTSQTPHLAVMLAPPPGASRPRATHTVTTAATLAPGAQERVRVSFAVAGTPDLWAPGHPALYAATIQTSSDTQLDQVDRLRIGLRAVTVSDGQLYLNDRPVRLSGASIEEDMPGHGPALTPGDIDTIVGELRSLHANVTRSQYPLSQALLDRLDEAGILVWSQAPIYHRDELLVTPAERDSALSTLASSVLQTRDHPAVLTHSVANELTPVPDSTPGTRSYLEAALQTVRSLDPTLPVSVDLLSYPGYPAQATYRRFALLGVDNYFGWYVGRAPHSTANIADLAPFLRSMHAYYPQSALVMSEFGAEARAGAASNRPGGYAYQSDYIRRTLSIVRGLGFMNGSIYWTLREYAVKPYWYGGGGPGVDEPRDSFHHKGLITYEGVPKPAFAVAAGEFAATPLYRSPPATLGARRTLLPVLAVAALLALIALIALIDVRIFVGIRDARRRRDRDGQSGDVVPLRREDRAARRTFA